MSKSYKDAWDQFAAAALAGLAGKLARPESMSQEAAWIADAMLRQRMERFGPITESEFEAASGDGNVFCAKPDLPTQ